MSGSLTSVPMRQPPPPARATPPRRPCRAAPARASPGSRARWWSWRFGPP